jgi:hypothetical protein
MKQSSSHDTKSSRVGKGALRAVPTAAPTVGTADLAPRINRYVGAAFAHPTNLPRGKDVDARTYAKPRFAL